MLTEDTSPSLWFVEPSDDKSGTIDHRSFISSYPHRSLYQADVLINGHLNRNWNSCWTKVVAVNELIIGLIIFILGVLIVFFQLTFSSTAHGIWTGVLAFLAGLCAFFTIIIRRHRYFLLVATVHILTGLASTILIFISIFALASQVNHNFHSISLINAADRQLNSAFHITLIVLGLYEKLLCYTFLVMIIRHTHKMVWSYLLTCTALFSRLLLWWWFIRDPSLFASCQFFSFSVSLSINICSSQNWLYAFENEWIYSQSQLVIDFFLSLW